MIRHGMARNADRSWEREGVTPSHLPSFFLFTKQKGRENPPSPCIADAVNQPS